MNAGELRHKIEILDSGLMPLHPGFYWASFKTLSGQYRYDAQLVWQKTTAEIRSRYFKFGPPGQERGPRLGDHVKVNGGRIYKIESVINVDEKNEEYVMTVSEF